jgi:hypothetical protein
MARTTQSSVTWAGVLPSLVQRPLTVIRQPARVPDHDLHTPRVQSR